MPATVILNPYSNRWEAGQHAPELEACLRLFQLLPKTQDGTHIHASEVQEHRTQKLTITTQTPPPIQADGE